MNGRLVALRLVAGREVREATRRKSFWAVLGVLFVAAIVDDAAIVSPGALLFGKILGVGIIGLATLTAGLIPILVKLALGGDLPEGLAGAVAGGALWFVLGMALYLTVAAALAALVERQEEVGSVLSPLTFLLVGTYIVAQAAAESSLGAVLAYVPLTSPLLVPTRLAIGVAGPGELIGSVVILLATIALTIRLGTLIYARAITRTGRRLKLTEVLRSA
ncbi:hypothetical protein BH24ACT4_BH24ACT4_09050 [soil metagenome]